MTPRRTIQRITLSTSRGLGLRCAVGLLETCRVQEDTLAILVEHMGEVTTTPHDSRLLMATGPIQTVKLVTALVAVVDTVLSKLRKSIVGIEQACVDFMGIRSFFRAYFLYCLGDDQGAT